jgi:hypothetical protein
VRTVQGRVTISSLKVVVPVLGVNKTFSGTPKVNQILHQNSDKSVVIYLNRQVETKAAGKPTSIAVSAIDAEVHNLKLPGTTISGSIVVEPTFAK